LFIALEPAKPEAEPAVQEKKPRIIDIKESVLLSLVDKEKLLSIRNNIVSGNADLAETQFQNIFN